MFSRKYIISIFVAGAIILTAVITGFLVYQKYFVIPSSPDDIEIWYSHTDSAERTERFHFATKGSSVVVSEGGKIVFPYDQNINVHTDQLQGLYADLYDYFSPTAEAKGKFPEFGDAGTPDVTAIEIRWIIDDEKFGGVMIAPDTDMNATKIREIIDSFAQARIAEYAR